MSLVPNQAEDGLLREHDARSLAASALKAHVRQVLDGVESVTPAPGAEPNGRRSSLRGFGQLERVVPAEVASELTGLVERHQLAFDSVLRAAWAILVARFTSDDEVVFGVAVGARYVAGDRSRHAILPFRVRIAGELRVRDFLTTVHALELAGRPFEDAGPLELERELAAISSSLRPESVLAVESDGVSEPAVPLTIHVFRRAGGELSLRLAFDRGRFRAGMPERIADAFVFVLEQLLTSDERLLHEVHAVRPEERQRLVLTFNATAREFPAQLLLHERFEEQVRARPEAVAVETQTLAVSYRELDRAANRLAHALRARGARPGVRIGICLDRGVGLVVAMLAVAKSGAAYVPLDPAYPAERLQKIASDAAPAVIVTEAPFAARFASELLLLDAAELATSSAAPPERVATAEDDCYVIYTSGSTGAPKGVVLQHRAVVNTCEWVTREFGVGPGDRLLFVTSPCFDLSVYDVFGALGAGATVVVAEQSLLNDADALGKAIIERNVTIWNSAPAVLELVMPFVTEAPKETPLRLVMLSGDFIPLALVARLKAVFPQALLMSLGGATEAAIWSNFHPIVALEPEWVSVPYGRPLQNCRYFALDARLEPVPIGAVGELYIGGACLARGYLKQPELTAAKFVPDPFSGLASERLYRTGDLVRYFEDGTLEILGRADDQVKIRGYRIELWEIEAALTALDGVAQAVCIAPTLDASGHRSLVAYVVPDADATLTEGAVKRELAQVLPDFMLPARVAFLSALPLSPNGKVDRKALPVVTELARATDVVAPPLTETERALAAMWRRILNRGAIGRDDDFFALGGHSLLAVTLIGEVKSGFFVELPVTTILEHPTVSALATRIDAARRSTRAAPNGKGVDAVLSFQRGGAAPELFCIGGLGGNPLGIRRLAVELGAEQPVHGLYNPSLDARSVRSIEELASELYAETRRIQPRGPYYLSGFSAGGVIAFELARMLRAAGEAVPLLIMLDAYNPKLPRWSARERMALFLTMCLEAGPAYAWRRLRARLRSKFKLAQLRYAGRAVGPRHDFDGMVAAFVMALSRYEPQPYDADVLLIRAAPGTASDVDYRTHESNGWRELVRGKLEVVDLGCRHEDVLREHAPEVARIMRRRLGATRSDDSR